MTDSGGSQPPGWYHAEGDPAGTQRYWDGAQWVGGPQAAQDSVVAQSVGYEQGAYGAAAASATSGNPAAYGSRVVAVIIDTLIGFGIAVIIGALGFLATVVSADLGAIILILGVVVGLILFPLWNTIVRQGQSGQTIGKSKQNIKLVSDKTGGPVGIGPAIIRALLASVLTSICYLDVLWPLFDEQKKRITDKILDFSVVDV